MGNPLQALTTFSEPTLLHEIGLGDRHLDHEITPLCIGLGDAAYCGGWNFVATITAYCGGSYDFIGLDHVTVCGREVFRKKYKLVVFQQTLLDKEDNQHQREQGADRLLFSFSLPLVL